MSKTLNEKIADKQRRIEELENEKKRLIQKQKSDERKERTSRLCRRHGLLEKFMPDLIAITDEQFEAFIRRGINTSYGQKILAEIVAERAAVAPSAHTETHHSGDMGGGAKPPKTEPSEA